MRIQQGLGGRPWSDCRLLGVLCFTEAPKVGPLLIQEREPCSEGQRKGPEAEGALCGVVSGACPPVRSVDLDLTWWWCICGRRTRMSQSCPHELHSRHAAQTTGSCSAWDVRISTQVQRQLLQPTCKQQTDLRLHITAFVGAWPATLFAAERGHLAWLCALPPCLDRCSACEPWTAQSHACLVLHHLWRARAPRPRAAGLPLQSRCCWHCWCRCCRHCCRCWEHCFCHCCSYCCRCRCCCSCHRCNFHSHCQSCCHCYSWLCHCWNCCCHQDPACPPACLQPRKVA